jgi:hypothetical protein
MGFHRGPTYNSVSEITGPSGFYKINTSLGPIVVYIDQDYDGGGWVLALSNREYTGGMNNLKYDDAINNYNYRTGGSNNGTNITVTSDRAIKNLGLSGVNSWLGLKFWSEITGRKTTDRIHVTQFVSNSVVTLNTTGSHVFRTSWTSSGFSSTYGFESVGNISNQVGGTTPGLYSHASSGNNLTTYDNDQDTNGGNCSTYYNNNPWWYSSCWTGNYFAGGGYQDRSHWVSSSSGNSYPYGAVYIK